MHDTTNGDTLSLLLKGSMTRAMKDVSNTNTNCYYSTVRNWRQGDSVSTHKDTTHIDTDKKINHNGVTHTKSHSNFKTSKLFGVDLTEEEEEENKCQLRITTNRKEERQEYRHLSEFNSKATRTVYTHLSNIPKVAQEDTTNHASGHCYIITEGDLAGI